MHGNTHKKTCTKKATKHVCMDTHTHTLLGTHHIIRLHFQFTSESSQLWTSHMSLVQKWTYHTSAPHVITNDLYNTGTKKTFFKEEELNNKTDRYKWWLLVFLFCYCPIKSWVGGGERSLCQDLAYNRTTQNPPDHCTETQTAVAWTCVPFIRSGQNHLARHNERGKKTPRERGGKTTSGNGQAWSLPSPRGKWRTGENGGNWLWSHLWCPNG